MSQLGADLFGAGAPFGRGLSSGDLRLSFDSLDIGQAISDESSQFQGGKDACFLPPLYGFNAAIPAVCETLPTQCDALWRSYFLHAH